MAYTSHLHPADGSSIRLLSARHPRAAPHAAAIQPRRAALYVQRPHRSAANRSRPVPPEEAGAPWRSPRPPRSIPPRRWYSCLCRFPDSISKRSPTDDRAISRYRQRSDRRCPHQPYRRRKHRRLRLRPVRSPPCNRQRIRMLRFLRALSRPS